MSYAGCATGCLGASVGRLVHGQFVPRDHRDGSYDQSFDRVVDAVSRITTDQIDQANASGRTPVVFVHGPWLLPSSWDRCAALFDEAGYRSVTPGWPDEPETVDGSRAD